MRRSSRTLRGTAIVATSLAAVVLALPGAAAAAGRCGTYAWCNMSLSPAARAQLLLKAMSESDRIGVLTGGAASDVGFPGMKWTDGAVGAGGLGSGSSPATAMPAAIALAANFDPAAAYQYGAVVGAEVKHRGFDGDFGPTVNIMRTPVGGCTFEAYGEDPYLSAQTAVGWVDGLQAQGVMADPKHFAENNQEGQFGVSPTDGAYGGRSFVNVHVDARTLHEIELQPFEAAVTQAHAATVMCSYNQINGSYSCANPWLLTRTLRDLWGFDGFVASDAIACHETPANLMAGLNYDIADSCYTYPEVEGFLAAGQVSQATIDRRVFQTLRELFAFGFFDHPTWPKDIRQDATAHDQAVADQVEEGGAVLLRNRGVLPIDPAKVHSIAVIGPAANQYILGNGSSQVTPYATTPLLKGITARAAQSHIQVSYDDGTDMQSAEALAKRSNLAIVVAADTESEGVDKPCMSLVPQCSGGQATPPTAPQSTQLAFGDQDSLIQDVAAANPRTVVVLETGAPVLTPWRGQVAGLLEAWYPGQDGGTAVAHVLFGDTDPGGRLPATFPRHAGDIPTAHGGAAEYPGVLDPATNSCNFNTTSLPCPWYQEYYSEGVMVGYRWYDSQHIRPAYPFGFGLSYTRFSFHGLSLTRAAGSSDVTASVTVRNVGRRAGWAVPELYVSLPSLRNVPEPPWQLKGTAKVWLEPGETRQVEFPLNARPFSYWSDAHNGWEVAPGCDTVAVGGSSRALPLRAALAQGGAKCTLRDEHAES